MLGHTASAIYSDILVAKEIRDAEKELLALLIGHNVLPGKNLLTIFLKLNRNAWECSMYFLLSDESLHVVCQCLPNSYVFTMNCRVNSIIEL